MEKKRLINNKLMPYYRILFDKHKYDIQYIEKINNKYNLKRHTKENPETVAAHIATCGLSILLLYFLIKLEKKEFKEQLEIWRSINKID